MEYKTVGKKKYMIKYKLLGTGERWFLEIIAGLKGMRLMDKAACDYNDKIVKRKMIKPDQWGQY